MPIACSNTALTGADGLVMFAPAGVNKCLSDFSDFPAGSTVQIADHGFQTGDSIAFGVQGAANLDSALTAGALYTVGLVTPGVGIEILDPNNGNAAVIFNADGGTGTANTPGAGNHIQMAFAEALPVCSVQSFQLSLSKDQVDVTTLPCSITPSASGRKVAPVRKQQGTFLNGEGSMEILFTKDQAAMGNRLLADSVMTDSVCRVKLYVDSAFTAGVLDDSVSSYFEGDVNLLGFDLTVNTSDALVATVNFALADAPKHLFHVAV